MTERSINDGGLSMDWKPATEEQQKQKQQQVRQIQRRREKEARARMSAPGEMQRRIETGHVKGGLITPDLNPKNNTPTKVVRNPAKKGGGQMGITSVGAPEGGWRGNGKNAQTAPADAPGNPAAAPANSPGNIDGDPLIENRKAFFKAQKKTVGTVFDEDAHRRDPNGNLRAAKDAPMASDGDVLPGRAEYAVPGMERMVRADQKDAGKQSQAKQTSDSQSESPNQQKQTTTSKVSSTLDRARSTVMNNPLMVGGAIGLALFAIALS